MDENMSEDILPAMPPKESKKTRGKNGKILSLGKFFKDDIYASHVISCQPHRNNGTTNRHIGAALCFSMDYYYSLRDREKSVDANLLAFYKNMRFAEILLSKKRSAQVVNWKLHRQSLHGTEAKLNKCDKLNKELMNTELVEGKIIPRLGRHYLLTPGMPSGSKIDMFFSAWLALKVACNVKVCPLYDANYNNIAKTDILERLVAAKKRHFRSLAEQHAQQFLAAHRIDKSIFENQKMLVEDERQ